MYQPYIAIFGLVVVQCCYSPTFQTVEAMSDNVVNIVEVDVSGNVEEMEVAVSRASQSLLWVVWAAIIC